MATNAVDVYVKLSSGRAVQYDLDPGTSIERVIELVAKEEGVCPNQVRLKYQGKSLDPCKTVRGYGVRAETILKSEVRVPKPLTLVINLPDDTSHSLTLSNLDTSDTLVKEIRDTFKLGDETLEMECKGQRVTSSSSKLLDLGIDNTAEVTVKKRDKTEETNKTTLREEEMDDNEKESVLSSFQTQGKRVEVVFSFDTTGSMFVYLEQVRTKLKESCTRLLRDIPGIRIGLLAHGDYCDQDEYYVIRSVDLTDDVDRLVTFAFDVPSTGGGDSPECYEWALRRAQHLDWGEDSAKALVMIGDDHPHPPCYTDQNIRWKDELDLLQGMGVKVYGVQCGSSQIAQHFYAHLADQTSGRHLKLSHLDVITDMFLAVCYRETSQEMLEEFQQELEGAGKMSEGTAAMFNDLKETEEDKRKRKEDKEVEDPSSRESSDSKWYLGLWWNYDRDTHVKSDPSFTYDAQTDHWSSTSGRNSNSERVRPSGSHFLRSTKSKKHRRCSVM